MIERLRYLIFAIGLAILLFAAIFLARGTW
jgi:hypothetical protein